MLHSEGRTVSRSPCTLLAVALVLLLLTQCLASTQQPRRRRQQRRQQQQLPSRSSTPCLVCVLHARPSATPSQPYAGFNSSLHGTPQPLGRAVNATAVAAAAAAAATAAASALAGGGAAGSRGAGRRLPGSRGGGFVYVPRSYHPSRPSPLAVMLHGAGGRADPQSGNWSFGGLRALEESRLIVVVPESAGRTWDAVRGGAFGPDVAGLDAALAAVFGAYAVDPGRVALAGHSDGASYALSLGLGNPQLFTHLVAFSPGFMRPPPAAAAWLDAAVAAAAAVAGTAATASAVGNSTTARLALPTPEAGGSTPGATDAAQAAAKAQAQAQERVMAETATLTTAKPLGVSAVAPAKAAAALETVARQAVHLQGGGRLPRVFVAHGRGGRDPAGALLAPHRVAAAGCGLGRGVQGVPRPARPDARHSGDGAGVYLGAGGSRVNGKHGDNKAMC
ncbi:hypothetical protein CHLRE_06g306501v5 [Chlamydomonas reinhardtii]|uniref:Phospholipase/carboxylesterase/thioesterase domain-containing protein n=1 Tax=Chlamydomonas reinhardtii TaxID=3055 RepID=A0A2K3DRD5_CHLRE|nr:uncharacterized protein CHLRE_06g306501v5 [Chlamydomonas reinhardtii]PNW83099.1 hypothetical protein CHLRE_06g306501v5 [Chlamydomonas reinhardtii]